MTISAIGIGDVSRGSPWREKGVGLIDSLLPRPVLRQMRYWQKISLEACAVAAAAYWVYLSTLPVVSYAQGGGQFAAVELALIPAAVAILIRLTNWILSCLPEGWPSGRQHWSSIAAVGMMGTLVGSLFLPAWIVHQFAHVPGHATINAAQMWPVFAALPFLALIFENWYRRQIDLVLPLPIARAAESDARS